jgi:tRNA dimethylallyltransferase
VDTHILSTPFLVGPTAVGKTDVAVALARPAKALILSVDARQVYRRLDKGTGKPEEPKVRAMHRLLDIWEPAEQGTAAAFAREFWRVLTKAWSEGERVLVTCGAGLYMDACLGRIDAMPQVDPAVRRRLRAQWSEEGGEALHQRLRTVDPETAARLSPRDAQRVLRALEVWETTGKPLSRWQRSGHGPLDVQEGPPVFLLSRPTAELSERISARCRAMVESGLEEEIRQLLAEGVGPSAPAFKTLGYAEWLPVVLGERSPEEAMDLFIRRTRQYARRQMTWFRNRYIGVRMLRWECDVSPEEIAEKILAELPPDWGFPVNSGRSV